MIQASSGTDTNRTGTMAQLHWAARPARQWVHDGSCYFSIFQSLTHGRKLSMRFIMLVDLRGTAWIQT